jgi:hypothetical protein
VISRALAGFGKGRAGLGCFRPPSWPASAARAESSVERLPNDRTFLGLGYMLGTPVWFLGNLPFCIGFAREDKKESCGACPGRQLSLPIIRRVLVPFFFFCAALRQTVKCEGRFMLRGTEPIIQSLTNKLVVFLGHCAGRSLH